MSTESQLREKLRKIEALFAGVATQFLNQETLADSYQCRVWWWLSLGAVVSILNVGR